MSILDNSHTADLQFVRRKRRLRVCGNSAALTILVLCSMLGLLFVMGVAAFADDPQRVSSEESSDVDRVSDQTSAQQSERPLTAQTTSGYSRLRQLRSRDSELSRSVRPPVRSQIDRPSSTRPFMNRVPVERDSEDQDPVQTFPQPPVDSTEESTSESPRQLGRSFERAPARLPARGLDRSQSDDESAPRELPVPVSRPVRRSPKNGTGTLSNGSNGIPEDPELIPDDGGPVAEILLHYSATSEAELGNIFHDLFEQLGQTVRLQVCCPNEQSAEAFTNRWGTAAIGQGRSVHVINVNRPITVWARDRRICRQSADGQNASCFVPTAHATYDSEKQNDLVLPSLLWSTGLVPNVALSSLHLEGGNVVSNRRHVFVGANAFEDNEHRFDSDEALFGELTRLFGRPTIAIQGLDNGVPWIHTDMYLTPIDSKTILVASPVLGCELLPHRKSITAMNRGKPVTAEFDSVTADSQRQQRFDDVAKQLSDLGYQVIRMPALINVQKDWMVTYNNVIMDYQAGQRVVYMPIYNIPELDQTAAQTYRALGFEVKPIDVSTIFQLGGAIRCLANVTRRLPYEARTQSQEPEASGRLQVYSVDPSANRAREVRPRREKRPLQHPARDLEEPPARDYSTREPSGGPSVFGQPARNLSLREQSLREPGEFERPTREFLNPAGAVRERPASSRSDSTGRQPVDSED